MIDFAEMEKIYAAILVRMTVFDMEVNNGKTEGRGIPQQGQDNQEQQSLGYSGQVRGVPERNTEGQS